MANSISERSSIIIQFTIDTDTTAGVTGGSVSLLANRQYAVVDYLLAVTAGAPLTASITATDTATVPNVVNVGVVTAAAANTINRPDSSVTAVTPYLNLASNAFPSGFNNIVVRGGTLRVFVAAAGDFCTGYIRALPGNRYSATTQNTAYYANNTSSGAQGSSATQSI